MSNSSPDVADAAERRILRSWQVNAMPWSGAVRAGSIASRQLVTNAAVIQAVEDFSAGATHARVLDVGCGEGWLARELNARGFQVLGVDAVAPLIETARAQGGAEFALLSYADMARGPARHGPFDVAVCNFSLLGQASVEDLILALPRYLKPRGGLIIQTLHPVSACGEHPYEDGWRDGSWAGFGEQFSDPAPWYFRKLETWIALLLRAEFEVLKLSEPVLPGSQQPSSVIFTGRCRKPAGPV